MASMPKRQPNGRPSKSSAVPSMRPAVGIIPDSPPSGSGLSQADWDVMGAQARWQVVKKHNPKMQIRPAVARTFDDGQPSRIEVVPSDGDGGREPVPFSPVITDSLEEMRDLNEARVMQVALGFVEDVAKGSADIFKQTIFRDLFKNSLERKRHVDKTSAVEARSRLRLLHALRDRLLATEDAEFVEVASCECQPDPSAVESDGPPQHFRRICRACGHMWASLRCPHDEKQSPCPGCLKVPDVEKFSEE